MELFTPMWGVLLLGFVVLLFIGIAVGLIALRAARRKNLTAARRAKIEQIARQYPAEVQAVGGPQALEDPAKLREIIARLDGESSKR